MTGPVAWFFLLVAGLVAGVVGTAGGITSLVAYPALLAVGIPPLAANVTNSVALLGSGGAAALSVGNDLAGHRSTVLRWLPVTVLGSVAGAVLLVTTPAAVFDRVVPVLVATGSTVLLIQPWLARRQRDRVRGDRDGAEVGSTGKMVAGTGISLYNGYFGAGSGILLIALLLFTDEPVLFRANSLKNVLLFVADLLPAVLFAVVGTVVWWAVLPLGLGAVVGGLIGPRVARQVRATVLRPLIAACGFVLAGWLWLG